jgi:hypothetical protein
MSLTEKGPQTMDDLLKGGKNREACERAIYEMHQRAVLFSKDGYYSIRFGLFQNWIKRYKLR